jgi:DNA-binding NarL/FixJ family response regulator
MQKLKVLLADDHESFRTVLASFLRSLQGIELVGEAVDGIEAISKTEELEPDLVLMDVHMPLRNGIEATKDIKNHRPQTKVVMMSMDSSESYQASARAVADGYIPKSSMRVPLLSLIADEQMRMEVAGGSAAAA